MLQEMYTFQSTADPVKPAATEPKQGDQVYRQYLGGNGMDLYP